MSIAVYINETSHVTPLIRWAVRAATSDRQDVLVIVPRRQKGSPKWDPLEKSEADDNEIFRAVFDQIASFDSEHVVLREEVSENLESSSMDRIVIETRELIAPNPSEALVDEVATLEISRLIIPSVTLTSESAADSSWTQRLFQQAPCEVMMVWGSPPKDHKPLDVLIVADADTESPLAVRRGCQLSRACAEKDDETAEGETRLLYVQPDSDEVAPQLAERRTNSIVSHSGSDRSKVTRETFLGSSIADAVKERELGQSNLVMIGTRNVKKIRSLVQALQGDERCPSIAAIRPKVSMGRKVLREFQAKIRSIVPQLDREERISLVEKLEPSSKFNFDFCALISLSTLIAALGLWDDSAAVVIGAMLVAPLMTPLVGIGFSLIQGNFDLITKARHAVLTGFANAFVIGVFVGLFMLLWGSETSQQMAARDAPSFLDLFVAFASGIAGAYATGRKGLNGAIPGVAIAAALVPPIATSGMAFAIGNWVLCGGALLLFLTNIVFIVLGTALVFWAIGIDTRVTKDKSKTKTAKWTRYWFAAFVVVSLLIATGMTITAMTPDQKKDEDKQEQTQDKETEVSFQIGSQPFIDHA